MIADPEIEAKVVQELDSLGLLATKANPKPRPMTFADWSQLRYLGALLKEALRLFPVTSSGNFLQYTANTNPTAYAGRLRVHASNIEGP
jgi:Cytochrome P450